MSGGFGCEVSSLLFIQLHALAKSAPRCRLLTYVRVAWPKRFGIKTHRDVHKLVP
jgi:hypothetical protein